MKDRIKTLRKTLKMNQNEFANKIHKVTRTLQKYESGEIVPDYSIVQLIAKTFNVNPDWLLNGTGEIFLDNINSQQEQPDIISIPYYPEVSAAAGSGALVYDENTVKHLQISSAIINISTGDNVCLINATGNSMQPVIDDRDLLLVDLSQKLITDEGIYVIRLDTTLVVKRVQKILNGIILISDNPQYPPRELTADNFNENDAAVIGKVIAVIKNFNRNMM
ncbi:MAG: XRE family transcriptional regulator [Mucispirillum sp.]|nr:XRE family transcriptional regulator [Mucispirillum sp.]